MERAAEGLKTGIPLLEVTSALGCLGYKCTEVLLNEMMIYMSFSRRHIIQFFGTQAVSEIATVFAVHLPI